MPIETQGVACSGCGKEFDVTLEPNYPASEIKYKKVKYCPFCGEEVEVEEDMEMRR
jgi:endogenous inhibitor of DNA gyrase (YacG/DUF329 family)